MNYQTKGLVLKSFNQREYDRLYLIYTKNLGKILATAYQVRRTKNLLSGHLEPFLLVDLELNQKHNFYYVTSAITQQHYYQPNLDLVAQLHLVTELIQSFTELYEPDDNLFTALLYANNLVTASSVAPLAFLEVLAKVLAALGIAPSALKCVASGQQLGLNDRAFWSSLDGGLILASAQSPSAGSRPNSQTPVIYLDSLKLLHLLINQPQVAARLKVKPAVRQEATQLLIDYIQLAVQTKMRALPFVHSQIS